MKKFLTFLTVAAVSFSLAACGGGAEETEAAASGNGEAAAEAEGVDYDNPIYIGVIDSLTGTNASNGEYSKEGADMAMNEINEAGGVMGRAIEIVYEDDQGTEAGSTNAFQKIVSQYDLAAVSLSKFSSMVLAMEQFIADEGIPSICCGSSINIEASTTPNLFSTRKSDSGSGVTIANFAAQELGVKKVAILHAPDALGTSMAPVIQENLEAQGVEVVSVQQFANQEKNFAPYIATIVNSDVDCLIIAAQQQEAGLIMQAVEESGLDVPCIGSSASAQQVAIETSGGACEGWYSVTSFSPTTTDEPAASWIAKYNELYGRNPDMTSACMYDAVKIFAEAMNETQSTEWADIVEYIKGLEGYEGVCAQYTYNGTPMLASTEYVVQINDGASTVVTRIES